ncbi:MAG: hypothetical protein L3J96_00910 [Thermoplasmata archaeon]|nr:hypothetical protein [Thermoplasmata archaeon]
MGVRMRRRTVYVATIVAMLAMVGGWALATTTTTAGPAENSNITTSQPAGFTVATVGSSQVVTLSGTMATYSSAGTQAAGTGGLAGTPHALAVCAAGPCTENHDAVNGNAATAGDYAEQLVISVIQPATGGVASGFDVQVEITMNVNVLEFGVGYFSSGVSSAVTAQTVEVYLFIDLGLGGILAPVINTISVQFNSCLTTAACP